MSSFVIGMVKSCLRITPRKSVTSFHRRYSYPVKFMHFLRNLPETKCTILPNGVTIITEERECYDACVGFYIKAGPRNENEFENGITHFFEHLAFKGTKTRSKQSIQEQMSCTGAKFKCHTTRELTTYYAQCICEDVPLVVDILHDCLYNNAFDEQEMELQKGIVYAEMEEFESSPTSVMFDNLHSTAFQGTPLANTVMGPTKNLHNFNRDTISRYLYRQFDPCKMALVSVGGVKHSYMEYLAMTYFGKCETTKCFDIIPYRFTGSEMTFRDDSMPMANVAIAFEGPAFSDIDKVVMNIASYYLSGWDISQPGGKDHPCRLAQACSVGHICDSYESFNINYSDTGLWGVRFMSESLKIDDMMYNIREELMYLCQMVTDNEVNRAKNQYKTYLLTKMESCLGAYHDIGRWILYDGCRPSLYDQISLIDNVSTKDVRDTCTKYIYDRCPVVAAVGPTEGLPEYNIIRSGTYWLRL